MIDENMYHIVAKAHNDALQRGVLNLWTIYNCPKDFPDSHVARRFEVGKTATGDEPAPRVTDDVIVGELPEIRDVFGACGLTCLTRDNKDEPQIVETWL